jgi:hypothetical protein
MKRRAQRCAQRKLEDDFCFAKTIPNNENLVDNNLSEAQTLEIRPDQKFVLVDNDLSEAQTSELSPDQKFVIEIDDGDDENIFFNKQLSQIIFCEKKKHDDDDDDDDDDDGDDENIFFNKQFS